MCVRGMEYQARKLSSHAICVLVVWNTKPGKWAVMYMCVRAIKPGKWAVMYMCVRGIKPGKWAVMYMCVRGIKPGKWAVMYLCVKGINFASFYNFSIGYWNYSDSVVFFNFSFYNINLMNVGHTKLAIIT